MHFIEILMFAYFQSLHEAKSIFYQMHWLETLIFSNFQILHDVKYRYFGHSNKDTFHLLLNAQYI